MGRYLTLLVLLTCPLDLWAQPLSTQEELPPFAVAPSAEVGMPFFYEHFTRKDYRQHHQNWTVTQDARGVIYTGNNNGILEYDGATWRLIETPSNTVIRSLATDAEGTVYAGAQGDVGYLAPDSLGMMRFVSLRSTIAPRYRDFTEVWGTYTSGAGVYFQTPEYLFRWDERQMKAWQSEQGFHTAFVVRDKLYVREFGVGLLEQVGEALQPVPGGRRFADTRVYMMAPYSDDQILIATREAGFFLFDGTSVTPFATEVDAYLREHRLYHGVPLPGGLYALGTLDDGGIVVIDAGGRFVRLLNEPVGVLDDWINHLYVDAQGGLWVALDNQGIVRVDIPSALSAYTRERGLDGYISDIQRHKGQLYVATSKGLYVLEEEPLPTPEAYRRSVFKQLLGYTSWAMHDADSVLFVGTEEGLYGIRGEAAEKIDNASEAVYTLLEAETRPGQIFLGREDGLALLEHAADGWRVLRRIMPVAEEVRSIAAGTGDTLWVSTASGEVLRFRFAEENTTPTLDVFTEEDGLPQGALQVAAINEDLLVGSVQGIFRYREPDPDTPTAQQFYRDTALMSSAEPLADSLLSYTVDEQANFWLVYPDRIEIATPQASGAYVHEAVDVLRFSMASVVSVFVEEDGIAWIGNGAALIRYDPRIDKPYDTPFSVLIRAVTSAGTGRVLYGGADPADPAPLPVFAYIDNDLRFEFAAPSFNTIDENQYQVYLEGHDAGWSDWTYRRSRAYTNLHGRGYRFRVRARNGQGIVSQEAVFGFRIMPPWYRTWWAYGVYLLMLLGAVALTWRYRAIVEENKRAQEQARELARERVVNERLQQANRRLQEANDSLTKVNKLKDEFLATTSHELRTPLTAILGFTAVLQEELTEPYKEFLDPIESNGQRLLQTVNSLLELAKLRAGMMEVHREIINVGDLAAEVNRLLAPLAHQKALLLELISPAQPLLVNLDRRFIERILNNLIGNAIKFTEEGMVSVRVERHEDRAIISVTDTGIGIEEGFIPHMFDEFKQESTGLARSYEGSGLGLSITARLVELLDGTIHVASEKGRGSVFTVSLPLYQPPVEEQPATRPHPAVV